MNTPSEGASRDAFLWKAVEQFEGLARWVAEPLKAEAWEDGAEAVFTVRQDDYELLRFTVSFDDDGARSKGWDQKLILTGEWQGEASELLVLGWKGSLPDFEQGLDSRADFAEGKYANAMGAVVQFLRDKLSDALEPKASASSRQVALLPLRKPANMIDTQFEPTPSVARAEPVLPREDQPGVRHAAVLPHMPDLELLRHALDALPEIEALHANAIFAGFIKAAGSPSPLRQGDIVAFVQGGLEDLHAFQEAYLDGGSTLTQAGVGLKGAALIGALAVALGAETMTGVFAFGPIIGHSIEALPLAGVGSFLIGGGLLPMAQTDKARRNIVAVALAWGLAVSSLSAKNDRLAEPVQMAFAKSEETVTTEWLAEAARLKLNGIREKIRLAREDKAKSQAAYLSARKNRPLVLDKAAGDVRALEREEGSATAAWVETESVKHQALKTDPSRAYAEGVVFVICSILNTIGPVFIGQYLSRVESDHNSALGQSRRHRHMERKARGLRRSESTQKRQARVMVTAMRSYYADILLKSGRFTDAEAEKMVNSAFGNAGTIVKEAVEGFRSSIRPNRTRFAGLFLRRKSLE